MPISVPAPAAQEVRQRRALRIVQLRRQVLAAALATFALAFAFVAVDGSISSSGTSPSTAGDATGGSAGATQAPADQFDDGSAQQFDDGSGFAGSSADPVQTRQS